MDYIIGKYKTQIYKGSSNYIVGLFRVKKASEGLEEYINKTMTFTGNFLELNNEDTYKFEGNLITHEKYGNQFSVEHYEVVVPEGVDAVVDFLSSSLIKGCGEKTSIKIVDTLGDKALDIIKKDENALLLVPGITQKKATVIRNSILKHSSSDELIIYLTKLGFSTNETLRLIESYGPYIKDVIEDNIYNLLTDIDFNKLDEIYLSIHDKLDSVRIKACIIESMKRLCFLNGDTYTTYSEIYDKLKFDFGYTLELNDFDYYVLELQKENEIINNDDKYFLSNYYDMERDIAYNLKMIKRINNTPATKIKNYLENYEEMIDIKYSSEQKSAIVEALKNDITIITGGPGTGKTTIVKAIVKLFKDIYKIDDPSKIVLLAPTGRASKRLSEASNEGASTIHRFLKWNKESNDFQVNEDNKVYPELVIVDESSMIDEFLFDALLKGLGPYTQLILVGDYNQLPSVGPGNILKDLIDSDMYKHIDLRTIYRQSKDSYIPYLALNIKNKELDENMIEKKDDYNFIICDSPSVKDLIKEICHRLIEKDISSDNMQVLIPMYKGDNGIDNINHVLQNLYNPASDDKTELRYGEVVYRENDKVLQLTNNPDNNVFNGDIGYIEKIDHSAPIIMTINFNNQIVGYHREDLKDIKLAYAISIHKSQGSEFDHVIMPICNNYFRMLYNKLIYTGVSRAKKSLILLGEPRCFMTAIMNDYSKVRKTNLVNKILEINYTNNINKE